MYYLRFTHLRAYADFLKTKDFDFTHFDVADISPPGGGIMYSAVATQRIGADCLAVCHEILFQESAEVAEVADAKDAKAHVKKIENTVWKTFSRREQAVKDAGLQIRRGILTTTPPEVLIRAK
jgi:hypothetical protein